MKPRHASACARCKNLGRPRQLNELLRFDKNESIVVLCNQCVRLLKFADAKMWKWFREYRDRLTREKRTG